MYVLLSSAARVGYRDDVLRAIASPIDTEVQFRYEEAWIAPQVLADPHLAGSEGVVCFLDADAPEDPPLFPVRRVRIERLRRHGSTFTVALNVADFARADWPAFTREVYELSGKVSPIRVEDLSLTGRYFFGLKAHPPSLAFENSVTLWEEIATRLASRTAYKAEPYFWTVIGVDRFGDPPVDTNLFHSWPHELEEGARAAVLVYHYHPSGADAGGEADRAAHDRHELSIEPGGIVLAASNPRITIDSRYDLKQWWFEIRIPSSGQRSGWIRMTSAGDWGLELSAVIPAV